MNYIKDAKLIDDNLQAPDIDLIFTKNKDIANRKMSYRAFKVYVLAVDLFLNSVSLVEGSFSKYCRKKGNISNWSFWIYSQIDIWWAEVSFTLVLSSQCQPFDRNIVFQYLGYDSREQSTLWRSKPIYRSYRGWIPWIVFTSICSNFLAVI